VGYAIERKKNCQKWLISTSQHKNLGSDLYYRGRRIKKKGVKDFPQLARGLDR
jgi:hypothetical protein